MLPVIDEPWADAVPWEILIEAMGLFPFWMSAGPWPQLGLGGIWAPVAKCEYIKFI